MAALSVPPFDEAAKQHARRIAAAAGKPKTGEVGLKAIHAALNLECFSKEQLAWEHFGISKQRFYEWKPLVSATLVEAPPPPPPPSLPPLPLLPPSSATAIVGDTVAQLSRASAHGHSDCSAALLSEVALRA